MKNDRVTYDIINNMMILNLRTVVVESTKSTVVNGGFFTKFFLF